MMQEENVNLYSTVLGFYIASSAELCTIAWFLSHSPQNIYALVHSSAVTCPEPKFIPTHCYCTV